jgi:hypothetical protein
MTKLTYAFVALWALTITGCSAMGFAQARAEIKAALSAQAAGTYNVEIRKDGNVLVTETWVCAKGIDDKLDCKKG